MIYRVLFTVVNPPVYPASCSRSKHTEEFVTPFRSSPSIMPLYPVRTVAVAFCPVLPCGVTIKLFSFKCLSLDLLSPVRRSSSARLILARLKFSPCSCFISLIACVMIFYKSLHVASSCINPPFLMHWLIISIRGGRPVCNGFFNLTRIGYFSLTLDGYFNPTLIMEDINEFESRRFNEENYFTKKIF